MKYKSISIFIVLVCISLFAEVKEIETSGSGSTYKLAVSNAVRNAIEQVAGLYMKTESEVNNFNFVKDNILSKSEGFCKSYDILQKKSENGIWSVSIKAIVAESELESELENYGVIIGEIGNPRMLVFYSEDTPKHLKPFSKQAIIRINQFLLDRGFNVSDFDQLEEVMESDSEWNSDLGVPVTKVQELAKKFNADIFVTVAIDENFDGKKTKKARVITNMFTTTTAKKLGVEIGGSRKVLTKTSITNDLIDEAVASAIPGMMKRAMNKWKNWKNSGKIFIVEFLNLPKGGRTKLQLKRIIKKYSTNYKNTSGTKYEINFKGREVVDLIDAMYDDLENKVYKKEIDFEIVGDIAKIKLAN